MTARHAHAPENALHAEAGVNGNGVSKDRLASFSWEDWFSHASPQQRLTALGLAQQQGLVYPHQLPPTTNGVHAVSAVKDTHLSLVVSRLLAGKSESPPPLHAEALAFVDGELDDLQRQAVRRAIFTPDLFLLHGLPGTGKSRVLTEIMRQAALRGSRVLFLASQPATLDTVLERLVGAADIFAIRYLDSAEKLDSLPAWLRGFTLEEQKQAFLERTLTGARANHAEAMSACRQRADLEPLWAELLECVEGMNALEQRRNTLLDGLPQLPAQVERDSAFAERVTESLRPLRDTIGASENEVTLLQARRGEMDAESRRLAEQIAQREPAYRAKKGHRFWTPAFWANSSIVAEMESLLQQQATMDTERQTLAVRAEELTRTVEQLRQQMEQQRRTALDQEIEARRNSRQREIAELDDEQRRQESQWTALCGRLGISPAERTVEAIRTAQETWRDERQHIEAHCQFAQQWSSYVEQAGPQLAARLPALANVTAAPLARWLADVKLRESVGSPFDCLIVDDADALTEADVLKVARHAQRGIFTACALAEAAPTPIEKPARSGLTGPLAAGQAWQRLWRIVDGDTVQPHSWLRKDGRLICQLLPLGPDDHPHVESERLADADDIELRILHRPRTQPCLAQVIFPASRKFEEAFLFMVREVQEFPLEPLGRTGWWSEDAERWSWHLAPTVACVATCLEIAPGLRLGLAADEGDGESTKVACIEFEKQAGWDRAKAEEWLRRHRQAQNHERTVFLQTPYRFEAPLAALVQSVLRPGEWLAARRNSSVNGSPACEFNAVPHAAKPEWPREAGGLELELSAGRVGDKLPAGVRPGLPARGVVNFPEAQALVRRLECWTQKEMANAKTRIAVLALHASQVELLRRLVEQSEKLRGRTFALEISLPSRLRRREQDVVFLSLTRSHAQRCVAFGEDACELPLALTCARSKLYLFGDPGSLAKRAHWQGPVENFDAHISQQEQTRVARLMAYLQRTDGHTNGK